VELEGGPHLDSHQALEVDLLGKAIEEGLQGGKEIDFQKRQGLERLGLEICLHIVVSGYFQERVALGFCKEILVAFP